MAHPEGACEARMDSLRLRRVVSTGFLCVVEDICKPCAGKTVRENPRAAVTLDVRLTRMRRRIAGGQASVKNANPGGTWSVAS